MSSQPSTRRAEAAGDFDYEAHGDGYTNYRQPDPRFAAVVHAALGSARTVLNVGAGAGSYEPDDRYVVAIEPSAVMRAQRPPERVPAVDGVAEHLPFDDDAFEAVMAMATIHQWQELEAGLRELRRVARGPVVVLTWDPLMLDRFWLYEYAPELIKAEQSRLPTIDEVAAGLGGTVEVFPVPIPRDCTDGFIEAYYARPEMLVEPAVRRAQSAWGFVAKEHEAAASTKLAADLASGAWDERHGRLRDQPTFDGSLRVIVSNPLAETRRPG